ncbi:MAG: hypothetical protein MUC87_03370 [Bacteroidia bacterium]|jgi:hypothetical protein|nr:hypothetical protein [Bacteroidia bacterium]
MKKLLPGILAVMMLMGSCQQEESSSVDQTRIYTHYELFYDKNENKTYAKAYFTFGNATGTSLELSAPSEVKFNGDLLLHNATTGVYEKIYTGLVPAGTFVYKNGDGTLYTNTTDTLEAVDFPATPSVIDISKSQDTRFPWVGTTVSAGETIYLGVAFNSYTETTPGEDSIKVQASSLQNTALGAYVGLMDRFTITTPVQKPDAGGVMTIKYRAVNKNFQVVN